MNNINAVKMVRNIRDKQYEETKWKTHEEIKKYYNKNSEWAFPLVSIIITCYNYEQYIGECIESCLAQTYKPIEIIVVDDASTDNSALKIFSIYQFYENMTGIWLQENKGYSAAKNSGIERSRGEFLVFIDADDCLTPDSVELRMAEFEKNPKLDLVHGIALRWYGGHDLRHYNEKTYCHAQGRMYKKEFHKRFGLYYNMRSMSDKEWAYRIGIHPDSPLKKVVKEKKINKVVAWYRKHDEQMHKIRRLDPEYNAKIKKQFKKRIKQLKKEGVTKENTEWM